MFCVRQLTYCNEGWVQPFSRLQVIQAFNISELDNKYPKPISGEDSWLYSFEDVYPIYQTFHVQLVIGKCQVVENLIFHVNKFSNKWWREVIHKLELKAHQAIQSSKWQQ